MLRDRVLLGRRTGRFTLQWHLTNACEASCAHCYDRERRDPLPLAEALRVFGDFLAFCRGRGVRGTVLLTGGNPLRYPGFGALYRAVVAAGCPVGILGNPVTAAQLAEALPAAKPAFYQISLEGLPAHNDRIRGEGHFARAVEFLHLLQRQAIRSHVMLTLTRDNLDQVIPLAESLRGLADRFGFNRLSPVGAGAALPLPEAGAYEAFLRRYAEAARTNPHLLLKENLLNVLRHRSGLPLGRGCTGFGCGAAFNFVALLPDGEVHACRKFHSPLGNVRCAGLGRIYDGEAARRYRRGCRECRFCAIRNRCGGCLAAASGLGLDAFRRKDPYCFMGSGRGALGLLHRLRLARPAPRRLGH